MSGSIKFPFKNETERLSKFLINFSDSKFSQQKSCLKRSLILQLERKQAFYHHTKAIALADYAPARE